MSTCVLSAVQYQCARPWPRLKTGKNVLQHENPCSGKRFRNTSSVIRKNSVQQKIRIQYAQTDVTTRRSGSSSPRPVRNMQLFLFVGGIKFPTDIHLSKIFGRSVVAPSSAPKNFLRDDIWEPWVHKSPYKTLIPYWKSPNINTLTPNWKYWNGEDFDVERCNYLVSREECQLYSHRLQGMEAERQLAQKGLNSNQIKILEFKVSRWHLRHEQVLQGHSLRKCCSTLHLTLKLPHEFILSRQNDPRIQAMKSCWAACEQCIYELNGLCNELLAIRSLKGNISLGLQFANHMKKLDNANEQHIKRFLKRKVETKVLRRKIKFENHEGFLKKGWTDARYQAVVESDMVAATTDDYSRQLRSIIDETPLLWPFFSVFDRTLHIHATIKRSLVKCLQQLSLLYKNNIGFNTAFKPDNRIHVIVRTAYVGIRMSAAKIHVLWLDILDSNQEMYEMAVFRITSSDEVSVPTASNLIRNSRDFTIKAHDRYKKQKADVLKCFQKMGKRRARQLEKLKGRSSSQREH